MDGNVALSIWKELAMAITICLWGVWPAIAIGMIGKWAMESLWRNPEAAWKIQSLAILCMALAEAIAIYALVIALIIWFVL